MPLGIYYFIKFSVNLLFKKKSLQQCCKMLVDTHITSGDCMQTLSWGYPLTGWNFQDAIRYIRANDKWSAIAACNFCQQCQFSCRYWISFWNLQKCSGKHIEKFQPGSGKPYKRACMRSPLLIFVSITFLQDRSEQFILNYKLTELKWKLKSTSGPSPDLTTFNHTIFSQL